MIIVMSHKLIGKNKKINNHVNIFSNKCTTYDPVQDMFNMFSNAIKAENPSFSGLIVD